MPVYLYTHDKFREPNCEMEWEFEVEHGIKSAPLDRCPSCEKPAHRLIAGGTYVKWVGGAPTSKNYNG